MTRKKTTRTIRVVHVPVGEEPRAIEIEAGLAAMQALVGGYIQMVPAGGDVSLVCNEDGIALELPQNGCGILGPYFFTKTDPETGESVGLDDAEVDAIRAHVAAFRRVRHPGTAGTTFETFGSLEEFLEAHARRVFDANHRN